MRARQLFAVALNAILLALLQLCVPTEPCSQAAKLFQAPNTHQYTVLLSTQLLQYALLCAVRCVVKLSEALEARVITLLLLLLLTV
jgi:hypothetical protein